MKPILVLFLVSIDCFAAASGPNRFEKCIERFCKNLVTCRMVPVTNSGKSPDPIATAGYCKTWLGKYLSEYEAFPQLRNELTVCIESINKTACKAFSQNAIQTSECMAYEKKLAEQKKLLGS